MGFRIAAACALALAACASSPDTRFYTLEPRPADGPVSALAGAPVAVVDVELPPTLDRRKMVHRTGSHRVDIRAFERWSGPFDFMIQRTLSVDLASRLGPGSVLLPGQPEPAGGLRPIVVVVEDFAPRPDGRVTLTARWFLSSTEDEIRQSRRETIHVDATTSSPSAVAAAMSDAIAVLADRIAAALTAP